jgi:hypothetical protein
MFRQIFMQNRFKNVLNVDSLLNMSEFGLVEVTKKVFFPGLRDNAAACTHIGKMMIK